MGTVELKSKVVEVTFQSAAVAVGDGTSLRLDGASAVLAQVTGITTATITWEATLDGATWVAIQATSLTSATTTTTATADGLYLLNASGAALVRARISAWTDGTITVTGRSTSMPFALAAAVGSVRAPFAMPANAADFDEADIFTKTLAADATLTFANVPDGGTFQIVITQPTPAWAVTWPGAVAWVGGGSAPLAPAGQTTIFTFDRVVAVYHGVAALASTALAWGNITGTLADQTDLQTAIDAKVADAINDGTTTIAPSQNAVFDALALKAPLASPTFTGTVAGITKTMVGLGSVDNTSDAGKPVSTAQQTALNLKANLASPALTGTPTTPTAAPSTNNTQVASTAYVDAAVAAGGGGGAVSSVFTRTGAVVAASGDYTAAQVTNTPAGGIAAVTVQAAIDELDSEKQAVITGGATTIASSNLTASRALASDGSGKVAVSATTATELGYVSGVTSALQTQLGAKAPLASPTFTGTPAAPTAAPGTNTTQLATTAFVEAAVVAGGLSDWTESAGTYSSQEFAKFVPASATANIHAVVSPKGTGAFQLQEADGTTAGGNNRGTKAIDLQMYRSQANQVASGTYSFTAGRDNKASGQNSVAVGYVNVASGNGSCAIGGQSNLASGALSFASGEDCVASNQYSVATGQAARSDKFGQKSYAAGVFTGNGDAQVSIFVARKITTNGTATELFLDGSVERMTLANNTAWAFKILVVARRTDATGGSAAYEFAGLIIRDANAASTAIVGTVTKTVLAETDAAWDCDVDADTTNGALRIQVTGEAAKTIRWVARVETSEVTN